jgi:hypothetical protein
VRETERWCTKSEGRPEATSVAGRTLPEEEARKKKGGYYTEDIAAKNRDKGQLLRDKNLKRKQFKATLTPT